MAEISEVEVQRLLSESYSAPPVPKSLLKRIDQSIARQWQEPLAPASQHRGLWTALSGQVARRWRTFPVAAGLALALILAVALRSEAQAYTWASIVEALSKQAVVQLRWSGAGEADSSWLSLSQRKVGQRSGQVERLYDLAQGVVLERGSSESQTRRFKLPAAATQAGRDRLTLSFLLRDWTAQTGGLLPSDLQIVSERWQRVGENVAVRVAFRRPGTTTDVHLTLLVDPESHLLQSCEVRLPDGTIQKHLVTYSSATTEQLVAQAFPANLPIVDMPGDVGAELVARSTNKGGSARTAVRGSDDATNTTVPTPLGAASLGWDPIPPSTLRDEQALAAVDALLDRLWREHNVRVAAPAADTELLRRVYLDLAGRTPTVTEVRNYLQDTSPDRYRRLVERLLDSPDHATHLATVWRTFLLPEGVDLTRFGGVPAFDNWLSSQFGNNVPYDRMVRELLLAEGRLSQSGPLLFYSAAKLDAHQLAGRTARVFLGMRLDCAQCHNDPFEPWTQQDFWSYAAFFARISRPQAALESVSTVLQVRDIDRGEVMLPDSQDPVPPRFLDGTKLDDSREAAARRRQLARWLTGPDNPYFARAAVNRVWAHLFGRGIVDPVDGFGKRYAPKSSELLDLLAAQFIGDGFDLRAMFRLVALSRAYQLSSGAESGDAAGPEWFARMNVKMLTAEQVYDCITVASLLNSATAAGFTVDRSSDSSRTEFLQQFTTLAGRPTEYQGGIPQALTLMNGALISNATDLAGQSGLLKSLEAPFFTDDQRIEVLYLATLSRQPSASEWALLHKYVRDRDPDTAIREPLADILWALFNSAEFTMNH